MDLTHWLALFAGLIILQTGAAMTIVAPLRSDRAIGLLTFIFGAYLMWQALR